MKAVMFYGPGDIRLEEIEEPKLDDESLIIKIHRASICNGSDKALYLGDRNLLKINPSLKLPVVLGHEFSGEVVEIGRCVDGFQVGDRVTSSFYSYGFFAEYGRIHPLRRPVIKLPKNVSYDEGSPMELLAPTMTRAADVDPGETVVVIGLGPAGLFLLQEVKVAGALEVIGVDLLPNRLAKAEELGADFVINASKEDFVEVIRQKYGYVDVVIDAVGIDIIDKAVSVLRSHGKYLVYGVNDKGITQRDANLAFYRGIELRLSNIHRSIPQVQRLMQGGAELVGRGRIKVSPMITHHIGLSEVEKGIKLCKDKPNECIKIVIDVT